jgi:2-desacetyl-2-hydroxyethyl bacteriochlorophyllide A dehydrogenase
MNAHALVITGPHEMDLQSFELPALKSDDVLIRTEYSGVSQGTEVDAYRGARPELVFPTVTGYQSVGVVEAVGDAVKSLAVGDRVLFTTSRLPDTFPFTWMAGHVSHAVASTSSRAPLKVPDAVDPVEAALTAMVAVSLGGIQQIRVELGDVVLVSGQGLIGQAAAQLARSRGGVVVTTDISATRSALSRAHSADIALNPSSDDVDAVLRDLAPAGVDVVIETTGRADQFAPSVDRIRNQGTILLQGYYKQHIDIDFHPTHIKKPTIAAACGFGDMRLALSLLRWGKASMRPLITHLVPPADGPDLFAKMEAADPDTLGVVFDWSRLGE